MDQNFVGPWTKIDVTMAPSKQHPKPEFSDVLNAYFKQVVRQFYVEPQVEVIERKISNYIVNLQREKQTDDEIYLALADMNPLLGDPLVFYQEFVLKYDESVAPAQAAEKKAAKAAEKAAERAAVEFSNKRKCVELEQSTCNKQTKISELTTASGKSTTWCDVGAGPGCYVSVSPDLSVMAVAFTAYAFDGNPENGGDGIKIGLYRVQGARIAQRSVRESSRDEDGNLKYDGDIVRMKGDAYLVDCNVTGSDEGTSDNPKFSLLALLRDHVFHKVNEDLFKHSGTA